MAVGLEAIQERIKRHANQHMRVALAASGQKPVSGRAYRFSDVEGIPQFVGSIYDLTEGSIRYGDTLAVPDDRGVIHLAFLSSSGRAHITGSTLPDMYSTDEVKAELRRMWNHTHRDLAEPESYFMTLVLPTSIGPDMDMAVEEVEEFTGRVDRWFHADMLGNEQVAPGDFAEFRLRAGADHSMRARIEATPNGFAALTGRRNGPEDAVKEWRLIWCDRTIAGCIDYLLATSAERLEYQAELVQAAAETMGVLRYTKGMLNGVVPFDGGTYFIRNWVPSRMEYERSNELVVETLLDVRDVLGLED